MFGGPQRKTFLKNLVELLDRPSSKHSVMAEAVAVDVVHVLHRSGVLHLPPEVCRRPEDLVPAREQQLRYRCPSPAHAAYTDALGSWAALCARDPQEYLSWAAVGKIIQFLTFSATAFECNCRLCVSLAHRSKSRCVTRLVSLWRASERIVDVAHAKGCRVLCAGSTYLPGLRVVVVHSTGDGLLWPLQQVLVPGLQSARTCFQVYNAVLRQVDACTAATMSRSNLCVCLWTGTASVGTIVGSLAWPPRAMEMHKLCRRKGRACIAVVCSTRYVRVLLHLICKTMYNQSIMYLLSFP